MELEYKQYKDLERKILDAKMNLRVAEAELKRLVKLAGPRDVQAIDYSKIISNLQLYITDKDIINKIILCKQRVDAWSEYLADLEHAKDIYIYGIERLRETCKSLEMDVFYRHHIERKSLNQVAQELQYDYPYIRRINSRIIAKIKSQEIEALQKHTKNTQFFQKACDIM